ncbi:ATP synthase subunit B family protein [Candidatus Bandiella euplotis]|uniref:ATP synthase subunit b n=1 Tax=Candidatus Bandiella euplotis TaxID=1664265 RepID=A0ABZ0UPV9_9RICK|nr:hypothetical protein [Candidatus Bandiella woodruffii]WPX96020.1 ATP synthase subunit b' [Candidatus Bandiella woodruffii]
MPHLDFTYFFNQVIWSLAVFLLTYLTVGKVFCGKYGQIVAMRKNKVQEYLNKAHRILGKVSSIEKQIEAYKKRLNDEIIELERSVHNEISKIKEHRLSSIKNEIENKNLAHEVYLNHLKSEMIISLKHYSQEISAKLNSYLFESEEK